MNSQRAPYTAIAAHWKNLFGEKVRRVSLDPGFGCPNREGETGEGGCIFCDPQTFAPSFGDKRPLETQLREGLESMRKKGILRAAAYFQPRTNTFAPLAALKAAWDAAAAEEDVIILCVGTRPDCLPNETLDLLASYKERFAEIWLEIGLQSSHDPTLELINRGHTAETFADAVKRARARGLMVCAHVILGLPGETAAHELQTARFLSQSGVEGVKLHQLAVMPGTKLEEMYHRGEIYLLSEEEYVERAAAFINALPPEIILHRVVGDTPVMGMAPQLDKNRVIPEIRRRLKV